MCVEDYVKEFEMLMLRCDDVIKLAIKVERQRMKGGYKGTTTKTFTKPSDTSTPLTSDKGGVKKHDKGKSLPKHHLDVIEPLVHEAFELSGDDKLNVAISYNLNNGDATVAQEEMSLGDELEEMVKELNVLPP
ncbi:hypothetical protein GH714_026240 [Hevea brasiliensis]|uniref:Retrotransposon gag domain-containing protein n=1 Tax=Hevea brasiliensis TaxID=3981 RepID=A0A6A6KL83_HEVBR|nr:hypothetical protein GH714_026240 [Hevea brasiliensis]